MTLDQLDACEDALEYTYGQLSALRLSFEAGLPTARLTDAVVGGLWAALAAVEPGVTPPATEPRTAPESPA